MNLERLNKLSSLDKSGEDTVNAGRHWYMLQDFNNNTTCAGDVELGAPEACQLKSGQIRVERSFTSQVQPQ